MSSEILGKGWKFPLTADDDGSLAVSEYEENISGSIRVILATRKGERLMRPDFGCGIHDYVFEVVNTNTMSLMRSSVLEALRDFEPRIEVHDVHVSPQRISVGILLIEIDYRVIRTNNQFNIVYPFYLTEGT